MAKHDQAHMSRRVSKAKPGGLSTMTRKQMEYYMGAKLLELGVEPKSAIYRWTVTEEGKDAVYTYSAYWGEAREQVEQGQEPATPTA